MEYFFNRLNEWEKAAMLFGLGLWVLAFPNTIEASAFRGILETASVQMLALLYLLSGWLRLMSLTANGRWSWSRKWGPRARFVGSLVGGCLWGQMTLALWSLHIMTGAPPSLGIVVYSFLTIGEFLAAARAAADGRRK